MKVILREDVEFLGKMGDLVDVKPGYARNYLIPQNKGYEATVRNIGNLEHQKRIVADKIRKGKQAAQVVAEKLSALSISIPVQVGEEEKLFGSVTTKDICEALATLGHSIDRKQILLEKPIKELGVFDIAIKVQHDIQAQVKVSVTKAE